MCSIRERKHTYHIRHTIGRCIARKLAISLVNYHTINPKNIPRALGQREGVGRDASHRFRNALRITWNGEKIRQKPNIMSMREMKVPMTQDIKSYIHGMWWLTKSNDVLQSLSHHHRKSTAKKAKHLNEESARLGAAKSKSQFRLYKDRTHNSMQTKLGNDTDNRCLSISVRCQHKIT